MAIEQSDQVLPSLHILAYAVHPLPGSAEGLVNAGLIGALLKAGVPTRVATSSHGYQPPGASDLPRLAPPHLFAWDVGALGREMGAFRLASWVRFPPYHPLGLLGRVTDRIRTGLTGEALGPAAWASTVAGALRTWRAKEPDAVVWARATPSVSLEAAVLALRQGGFPLMVNYNDPHPRSLLKVGATFDPPAVERRQHRLNRILAGAAQLWTFPSRRLADLMAKGAGLDRERCFVVPHIAAGLPPSHSSAEFLTYAGRFYGSHFTPTVRAALESYASEPNALRLRFVLQSPPAEAVGWIRTLPDAELHTDASTSQALDLQASSAGHLVITPELHAPLLLTKVAYAVRSGLPTVALSPLDSTTADCVRASGGIVAPMDSLEGILSGLRTFTELVRSGSPPARDPELLSRFEPDRAVADIVQLARYARERFQWETTDEGPEPSPPTLPEWP